MSDICRTFSLVAVLVSAACTDGALVAPAQPTPFEQSLGAVDAEIKTHRDNLKLSTLMEQVMAEMVRHESTMPTRFGQVREEMTYFSACTDVGAHSRLTGLLNGLEATERGYATAIEHAGSIGDVHLAADRYSAGLADLVGQLMDSWVSYGCDD